jgi:hypothetical protein
MSNAIGETTNMANRNRTLLYFAIILLVLIFLCAVPLMTGLYSDCKTTVIVEPKGLTLVPIHNQTVTQEIYLQGRLKNLSIYFNLSNPSNPQGTVSVKLEQGGLHTEEQVKISKLVSGSFYQFKGDYSAFKEGSALLSVVANSTENTVVSCAVSATLTSGLPAAATDNNALNGPLEIQYNIFKYNQYFIYDTILFTLLLLVLILTSWLLAFKKEILGKKNYLFGCSFAIIFLSVSLNNPTASFFGQPISEAAYEFWYKAHQYGFFQSLLSLMSGEALAWLERIFIYIADKVSFNDKYVFVIAQLMELAFISAVASMPCLKSFRRYFSEEVRLVFCIFMGSLVFFTNGYYFYGVSYWSTFFFIAFALMNLDTLKKWKYAGGVVLTVILCVSRIYNVILIPVCLFLLLVLGKKQGRRFRILNIAAIIASTFQGLWSVYKAGEAMSNAGFLQNVMDMGIPRLINNTFYYQIQMLNSLFTHQANQNGLISNMIWLLLLIVLIIVALYRLFSKKHDSTIPTVILALLIFNLGTIAITVITSSNWAAISFPISYSAEVDWTTNYYQQADFHFSYAYICTAFLIMVILYTVKIYWISAVKPCLVPEKASHVLDIIKKGGCFAFCAAILIIGGEVAHTKVSATSAPTEWQAVYGVTDQIAYYIPINVDYPVATISLAHNSYDMMFAYLSNGNWGRWNDGDPKYNIGIVYTGAKLGDTSDIESKGLLSISAHKAITNFETVYVAVLYDRAGNELARISQSNSADRLWIDFMLDEPLGNVYCVAFELSTGESAYVNNALQLGVSMYALN